MSWGLLPILSLAGYALLLHLWSRRQPELSLLAALSGVMASLYLAAVAGLLQPAAWFLLVGGLLCIVLCVGFSARLGKQFWLSFLTPGVVIALTLSIAFCLLYPDLSLQHGDEFSHWAVVSKEMSITNSLPGLNGAVMFKDYPPGSSLIHYWVAKISGVNETSFYWGHFLMLCMPAMTLLAGLEWRRLAWIAASLVVITLVTSTLSVFVNSLMVDVSLGLFFTAGLYAALRVDMKKREALLLVPVLFVLPLMKASGFFLALIIVMALALRILVEWLVNLRRHKGIPWTAALVLLLLLIVPLSSHYSWKLRLDVLGINPTFKTTGVTSSAIINAFTPEAPEKAKLTIKRFYKALWQEPLSLYTTKQYNSFVRELAKGWGLSEYRFTPSLGLISWLGLAGLLFGAGFLVQSNSGDRRRLALLAITLSITWILYLWGLLVLYLFSFSAYEGPRLASYSRYVNTLLIPTLLLGWVWSIPKPTVPGEYTVTKRKPLRHGIYWTLLLIWGLGLLTQIPTFDELPRWHQHGKLARERAFIAPYARLIEENVPPDKAVFVVCQKSVGWEVNLLRFDAAPRRLNRWLWSVGDPYFSGDVWTVPLTLAQYKEIISQYQYVLLIRTDDQYYKKFGSLFSSQTKPSDRLFKVSNEGKEITLVPIGK